MSNKEEFFRKDIELRKKYEDLNQEIKMLERKREELASEKIKLMKDEWILTLPREKNIRLNSPMLFRKDLLVFDLANVTFIDNKAFVVGKYGERDVFCALMKKSDLEYELHYIHELTKGRRLKERYGSNIDFQFLSTDTIIIRTFRYNRERTVGHGREFQEEYHLLTLKDDYKKEYNTTQDEWDIVYEDWVTLTKLSIEKGRKLWRSTETYRKMVEEMETNRLNNLKRKTEPSLTKEEREHVKILKRKIRVLYKYNKS